MKFKHYYLVKRYYYYVTKCGMILMENYTELMDGLVNGSQHGTRKTIYRTTVSENDRN